MSHATTLSYGMPRCAPQQFTADFTMGSFASISGMSAARLLTRSAGCGRPRQSDYKSFTMGFLSADSCNANARSPPPLSRGPLNAQKPFEPLQISLCSRKAVGGGL